MRDDSMVQEEMNIQDNGEDALWSGLILSTLQYKDTVRFLRESGPFLCLFDLSLSGPNSTSSANDEEQT